MRISAKSYYWGVVFATLTSLLASGATAQADEQKARAAFRLGNAHYENGEFVEAAQEFEEAYQFSGKPQLLYNIYLAYRDANEPEKAAGALRKYLQESKDVPNREQLASKLRALEKGLEEEKEKKAAQPAVIQPAPVVVEKKPPAETRAVPPEQKVAKESKETPGAAEREQGSAEKSSDDTVPIISYIAMGVGASMIVGSVITGIVTTSEQSKLKDKCPNKECPANLESTKNTGETLAIVTDILLFGGIAAAGAGLALLLWGGDDGESEETTATTSIGCSTKGCSGSIRVRF
jgi:tetratricopeptide (TPR) repeat protein